MGQTQRHDYFPPESFGRAVQDNLGDDLMLRLRQKLGGQKIRISVAAVTMHDSHPLVMAVGRADAERLSALFDGEDVYIPVMPKDDAPVLDAVKRGMTNFEVARHVGITPRTVARVLARNGVRNPNRRPSVLRVTHRSARAIATR